MPTYRFLAVALDAPGHVHSILGFSEALKAAGHEVCLAHREKYRSLAEKRGVSFIPFGGDFADSNADELMINLIDACADKFRKEPLECFREMAKFASAGLADTEAQFMAFFEPLNKIITERCNEFDAIISDMPGPLLRIYDHLIPWFPLVSTAPLALYPSGPPFSSGYSVNSDKSKWIEFRDVYNKAHATLLKLPSHLMEAMGIPEFDLDSFDLGKYIDHVQSVGFYHYPADLDFTECAPVRPNWHRIDCWIRKQEVDTEFVIPEKLQDKPGKLIYFSLGTLASADITMMKKLIAILAKSPHRFIVSKGSRGDRLELADNMWGENYVNQIKIIEKVDLVITHGGNNTFMETLYYGKPMIVIPYFYDQYDNAQRVVEKNIGFRINPYEIEEEPLLDCIEKAIGDHELKNRIKAISQNMRNSNSLTEAIKVIEQQIEKFEK
ncbi:uncharacterized UDP-glucosyltransferase YjiC-like isoform X1 [Tetranychus urticae]|uniref:UDP-glycosyltransferase 201F1 n=1 Tax=Tetranychus urticae TaxID=32264 RepID=T1JUK9_TETUR|nr:uncharacterized UDP-glucosyltransferase YjiC-like [Tetranychus urticae]XP_015794668.1 uncharacterized UDP-glucosyltransferase YjiC-like isoform X1 [Tetranychus urticae]AHX56868.1 UDP-glycosyltransferase 201F1 [Tetranychus urticae]